MQQFDSHCGLQGMRPDYSGLRKLLHDMRCKLADRVFHTKDFKFICHHPVFAKRCAFTGRFIVFYRLMNQPK